MAPLAPISLWQWLPMFRWRIVATVDDADLIPVRLPRKAAVLVGSPAHPKWIAFDCPCSSGHRIMLNLDASRYPRWSISVDGLLTIRPSIDFYHSDSRCHFFVRNGRLDWVDESTATTRWPSGSPPVLARMGTARSRQRSVSSVK
jgi:hypothetical protein